MSHARDKWLTARSKRIDELVSAHAKLRSVAAAGWPTGQLRTAERFRRSINDLVGGMATVVGTHLQSLVVGLVEEVSHIGPRAHVLVLIDVLGPNDEVLEQQTVSVPAGAVRVLEL